MEYKETIMNSNKQLVIFIDSGDTIVDESTEILDENSIVTKADLIPGAAETIKTLSDQGYTIIMVADGLRQSFINVHQQHGLYEYYKGHIYSEDVGISKPHSRMFEAGLEVAGLTREDSKRVIMVGNNLERDIKGANDMDMISVHIAWSSRYPKQPKDDSEKPDYVINEPKELIELVDVLNEKISV